MSLFAAWTSVTLGAARIEPAALPTPAVPEPRRFRLAHNPLAGPAGHPRFRPVAEPASVSVRTPLPAAGRLCLEK
ncbi:hypothetical protein VY88_09790 [Azospirillum thiophilum]|uniref:Uncharacterized protein n=1 Tax=Azospirillum thiophilum TaxID=528244 RepID=A0AAC8ZT72_9PROT|nr:hypothetical protein [Azospirillum thiophilum]ALG70042.1 hypothetical protein AL072_02920 [Azospirillum thiophilum]KJR66276.1 hypothetical protein VY88_09790 [Azospirillum thiophilum]